LYICFVDFANIGQNFHLSNIFYIFIENSLQCVEYHINKNYKIWQKTAKQYTRSTIHGEYLLSDVVTMMLENREVSERTCEKGFIDAFVRRMLWQRRNKYRDSRHVELNTEMCVSDEAPSALDNEVMLTFIEYATSSLPMMERELVRAYKLGVKPAEIAEAMGVEAREVHDRLRAVKQKIKRRINIDDNDSK
jgi:DNA-directed RNA polymerase specialized sigma24 family protein